MRYKTYYNLLAVFSLIYCVESFSFDSVYLPIENLSTCFLNTPEKIEKLIKTHEEAAQHADSRTVNVTVIGGGPGGLASALHAYLAGAKVVLVEKRTMYARQQVLALEVKNIIPLVDEIFLGAQAREYVLIELEINRLEEMVYSVIRDLAQKDPNNMKVLYGYELKELPPGKYSGSSIVVQTSKDKSIEIPTNFLVGADSIHSAVRKRAQIPEMILTNEVPVMIAVYKNENASEIERLIEERNYHREAAERAAKKAKNNKKLSELQAQYDKELFYHNERSIYLALQLTEDQYNRFKKAQDTKAVAQEIIDETLFEPKIFKPLNFVDPLAGQAYPTAFRVDLRKAKQNAKVVDGMLITLLGDAAGTTHFFTGTGANRAVEDAKAIGQLVKSYLGSNIPDLGHLAEIYNNNIEESVCKMQKQVFEAKMGVERKLEELEQPMRTPSSKNFVAEREEKNLLRAQSRRLSKILNRLEDEQKLFHHRSL